ncbi:MAG TPA: nucleotidyltransferase domain-containing protein [Syntrophaceae bacterium]|nr:nucleotidyltransferase domain-containing protein [Syntrophaceae bacterium]
MLKRKKDRLAVKEFCNKVRDRLGKTVRVIKLLGSKVTGRDMPESDIDLFIVVSKNTPEVEDIILDIAFEIDVKHNVYISPGIVSQAVLKHWVWKNTPFIKNIERKGVPL